MKPKNRSEELHWHHKIDFQVHMTKPRKSNKRAPERKTRIQCTHCNVFIKWPSSDEIRHWNKHRHKFTDMSLYEFIMDFERNAIKSPTWTPRNTNGHIVIPLTATYADRDKMKKYNCLWYPGNKHFDEKGYWYTFSNNTNLERLLPWMDESTRSKLYDYLSTLGNYQAYD